MNTVDCNSHHAKFRTAVFILSVLTFGAPQVVGAQSASHTAAAHELFEVLQLEKRAASLATESFANAARQSPELAQLLEEFTKKYLSWNAMVAEYARIYTSSYSENEIRQLIQFYNTPLGQKLVAAEPVVMREVMGAVRRVMSEHDGELRQKMLQILMKQ